MKRKKERIISKKGKEKKRKQKQERETEKINGKRKCRQNLNNSEWSEKRYLQRSRQSNTELQNVKENEEIKQIKAERNREGNYNYISKTENKIKKTRWKYWPKENKKKE